MSKFSAYGYYSLLVFPTLFQTYNKKKEEFRSLTPFNIKVLVQLRMANFFLFQLYSHLDIRPIYFKFIFLSFACFFLLRCGKKCGTFLLFGHILLLPLSLTHSLHCLEMPSVLFSSASSIWRPFLSVHEIKATFTFEFKFTV